MDDLELRGLLDCLRLGERSAFEELYEQLKTPVFTVILRILGDRDTAEDVLQEVFLKLYRSPPGPEVKKPRAYLLQSARNLALDALRRHPREAALEDCVHLPASQQVDWSSRLDLERALAALPLEERQLVILHLNGGLKFREIAQIMRIPLGTALWRYQKAIGRLRSSLSDTNFR